MVLRTSGQPVQTLVSSKWRVTTGFLLPRAKKRTSSRNKAI